MAMTGSQEPTLELPHKLVLESRKKLSVSGVKEVESFDEASVVLNTNRGTIIIRGEGLHLQMLSLDGGQVSVDGLVVPSSTKMTLRPAALLLPSVSLTMQLPLHACDCP